MQALSGSPANFYVYTAIVGNHGRIMSLDLPHGGHLSHGYSTLTKKVAAPSIYFEVLPYRVDTSTGLIDYDQIATSAEAFRPKLLVSGASAYARDFDYQKLREIADINGSYLMYDMAHVSGILAAGIKLANPFEFCDIITTTTLRRSESKRCHDFLSQRDKEVSKRQESSRRGVRPPIENQLRSVPRPLRRASQSYHRCDRRCPQACVECRFQRVYWNRFKEIPNHGN